MDCEDRGLKEAAERFASDLTATVRAVDESFEAFKAQLIPETDRAAIQQDPATGIELKVNGKTLLSLTVEFRCCLDSSGRFLAIKSSKIHVFAGNKADRTPLFRYEYVRDPEGVPAAHIHVHAHRDAFTATMVRSGKQTKRGKRRADPENFPALSELHFPVGGHRFRPCLEDVLEMLIDEFGVDHTAESRRLLKEGRARWRKIQQQAAIRDDLQNAIDYLEQEGFDVMPRSEATDVAPNHERLREI